MTEQQEAFYRRAFHDMNRYLMVPLWRLGLGWWFNVWPQASGQVMVIRHTGRVSGKSYLTPVNYAIINGDVFCVAGFGPIADWYRNIVKTPQVEVWLPDGWWTGTAEDATERVDFLPVLRRLLVASGVVAPMFGLDPATISDEELMAEAGHYRIVRIRREEARTGPGGPGDLAWVWPVVALGLAAALLLRPRKPARRA
jgi:deazaflavin-dependent oxidoreductase (nitroreductase family)